MKTKAFILIIIAGILWGTSGIFANYLRPQGFTSLQMTSMRSIVSVSVLTIYILIKDRSLFKVRPAELLIFLFNGLAFLATATFYYEAMDRLNSESTAVVLMYTAPVMVMVFSVFFLGEKFNKLKGVATALMLVGCCFVAGLVELITSGSMVFNGLGLLIGFMSGVTYSAYNIITKIAMQKKSNPVTCTFYTFLFAAIASLISNPVDLVSHFGEKPALTVPLSVLLGIVTCISPYFLYTLAMRDLPAGTASALGIIEPMAATVFSVTVLHKELSVYSIIGIVMILGAVVLLSKADELPKIKGEVTADAED